MRKQTDRKINLGIQDYNKICNIHIIKDPEEEKLECVVEKVFKEIMAKDINLYIQEVQ